MADKAENYGFSFFQASKEVGSGFFTLQLNIRDMFGKFDDGYDIVNLAEVALKKLEWMDPDDQIITSDQDRLKAAVIQFVSASAAREVHKLADENGITPDALIAMWEEDPSQYESVFKHVYDAIDADFNELMDNRLPSALEAAGYGRIDVRKSEHIPDSCQDSEDIKMIACKTLQDTSDFRYSEDIAGIVEREIKGSTIGVEAHISGLEHGRSNAQARVVPRPAVFPHSR